MSENFAKDLRKDDGKVSSTAIIRYSGVPASVSYLELEKFTDLNHLPDSWLQDQMAGKFSQSMDHCVKPFDYSSLLMASNHPVHLGEVDVVSAAEHIKKLLKMPYSSSQVSLSVHRIGSTLLLNSFDIPSLLESEHYQGSSLQWLRDVFCHANNLPQDANLPRKNVNEEKAHLDTMFSKFLHRSILDGARLQETGVEPISSRGFESNDEDVSLVTTSPPHVSAGEGNLLFSSSEETTCKPFCSSEVVPKVGYSLDQNVDEIHAGPARFMEDENFQFTSFLRDVLWTFEDITMLVGSDLPIFGGGKFPAVSLRLRDSQKPINILTGMDYWLDNLMCNVPELIMCYHLKGIVQKYEKIKTSDLPNMEQSRFSPKVIKDIAQNVLSFLKSNCTKEGHTYWLFKASKDDVVKLYDLTSICSLHQSDDASADPFRTPVGMLLYSIATNMYKDGRIDERTCGTFRALLKNSLKLLDKESIGKICVINCLLADLYLPSSEPSVPTSGATPDILLPAVADVDEGELDVATDEDSSEDDLTTGQPYKSINVSSLSIPDMVKYNPDQAECPLEDLNKEERCREAIGFILAAFKAFESMRPNDPEECPASECTQLESGTALQIFHRWPVPRISPQASDHRRDPSFAFGGLCQRVGLAYSVLAQVSLNKNKFGRALRFLKIAMSSFCRYGAETHKSAVLVKAFMLIGDVSTMLPKANKASEREDFLALSESDVSVAGYCKFRDDLELCGVRMGDVEDVFLLPDEQCLLKALKYYQIAVDASKDLVEETELTKLMVEVTRRLGNVRNELGVLCMRKAADMSRGFGSPTEMELTLWKQSFCHFESGIDDFTVVGDRVNAALLYSNMARLMRLCAQVYGNSAKQGLDSERGSFTIEESNCFTKSFDYYNKALAVLEKRDFMVAIWDDVSFELSTAYFNMGALKQDHGLLLSVTDLKLVKEISGWYIKALHLCEPLMSSTSSKRSPAVHRVGQLHHRLASLYHHVVRNQQGSEVDVGSYKSLSELHCRKVYALLSPAVHPLTIIKTVVEHVVLHSHASVARGVGLKAQRQKLDLLFLRGEVSSAVFISAMKQLCSCLQTLAVRGCDGDVNSSCGPDCVSCCDLDVADALALLNLLTVHMKSALGEILKKVSASKQKTFCHVDVAVCKRMYEIFLRGTAAQGSCRERWQQLTDVVVALQDCYNRNHQDSVS